MSRLGLIVDRALRACDVEPRSFRALLTAYLTIDFRSPAYGRATGSPAETPFSPLFWVLGQNVIIGAIVALVMFARVDAFFFAFVALTVSALVTAGSMIVELRETVGDGDDLRVVGHLPIPARTYAAVRIANLLVFVLITIVSVNLFPVIIGSGLRDADLWFALRYSVAAFAVDLSVAAAVVGVFAAFGRRAELQSLQDGAAWLQCGLILVLFYGGQYLVRDKSQQLAFFAYDFPPLWSWIPTAWIAASIAPGPPGLSSIPAWILVGSLLAALVLWALVLSQLTRFYDSMRLGKAAVGDGHCRALAVRGELLGGWQNSLLRSTCLRSPQARIGYWFVGSMLGRDADARLKCWSSFSYAAAPLVMGIAAGNLADPWQVGAEEGALSIATIHLLAMAVPGVLAALRSSREFRAGWIFGTAPLDRPREFLDGILWQVGVRYFAPTLAVVVATLAWSWSNVGHALMHGAVGVGIIAVALQLGARLGFDRFPFTVAYGKREWSGAALRSGIAIGVLATTSAGIHVALLKFSLSPLWLAMPLIGVAVVLRGTFSGATWLSPSDVSRVDFESGVAQ